MLTTATTSQPSSTEKNLTLTGRKRSTFKALIPDAGGGSSWIISCVNSQQSTAVPLAQSKGQQSTVNSQQRCPERSQLLTVNSQQSTVCCQLLTVNCQLSTEVPLAWSLGQLFNYRLTRMGKGRSPFFTHLSAICNNTLQIGVAIAFFDTALIMLPRPFKLNLD